MYAVGLLASALLFCIHRVVVSTADDFRLDVQLSPVTVVRSSVWPREAAAVVDGDPSTAWNVSRNGTTNTMNATFDIPLPIVQFEIHFGDNPVSIIPSSIQVRLVGNESTWVVNINRTCTDTFYHWGNDSDLQQCVSLQSNATSITVLTPLGVFWVINKTDNNSILWSADFSRVFLAISWSSNESNNRSGNSSDVDRFSVIELAISTFTQEKLSSRKCRCDPVGVASVERPCHNETGQCLCRPQDGARDNTGCRPSISPIRGTGPIAYYGPQSGGTVVQFSGHFLRQPLRVLAGDLYPCIPYIYRNESASDSVFRCMTTISHSYNVGISMPFHICWSVQGAVSCLITVDEYTYRPEPTVTGLSRQGSIASGGLTLTISGTNFDSIYGYWGWPAFLPEPFTWPHVKIFVDQPLRVDSRFIYNNATDRRLPSRCVVVSSTQIVCRTPAIVGVQDDVIGTWKSMDVTTLEIYLGTGIQIIANRTFASKFVVIVDPPIYPYGPSIREFNVYKGDQYIQISASGLLDYCVQDDYTVAVGGVSCPVSSVVQNMISCAPPTQPPPATPTDHDGARPLTVSLGNRTYSVGYVRWVTEAPSVLEQNAPVIGGAVGGGGGGLLLLVIIIAVAMCIRKRRRSEKPLTFSIGSNEPLDPELLDFIPNPTARDIVKRALVDSSRIELYTELGRGNFGQVYRGTYKDSRDVIQDAAIKMSHSDVVRTKVEFLMEAVIMAEFDHRNVLSLLAISISGASSAESETPYVVLPLMHNGDLRSFISTPTNSFVVKDLIGFGQQVAEGMDYLSSRLVHRDLAARNCMVDRSMTVKVADFGLARFLVEKDYYMIKDRERPLPFKWMAIESFDTHKPIFTTKTDVWSFGVLLWELMTRGSKPYMDIDPHNLRSWLIKGNRLQQPATAPDFLYDLMLSCWEQDPNQRPTFRQIAEHIGTHLRLDDGHHDVDAAKSTPARLLRQHDAVADYRPNRGRSRAGPNGESIPMRSIQPTNQKNAYVTLTDSTVPSCYGENGYIQPTFGAPD